MWAAPVADSFLAPAAAQASSADCTCTGVTATHTHWVGAGPIFVVTIQGTGCGNATGYNIVFDEAGASPTGGGKNFPGFGVPDAFNVPSALSPTLGGGTPTNASVNANVRLLAGGSIISTCFGVSFTLDPTIPKPIV